MGIPTYIIGVGGLGRGVAETVKVIESRDRNWSIEGFIDDQVDQHGKWINGLKVLGGISYLTHLEEVSNVIIAIANPTVKKKVHEILIRNQLLLFPNIIHPSTKLNPTVKLGIGNIISDNVAFSANIKVGNFSLIHFNTTVGHDIEIKDYVTIFPGVNLSGYCKLMHQCQVGTNVSILPQVTIGHAGYIGANAMVNSDVPSNCTVAGIPAKEINRRRG